MLRRRGTVHPEGTVSAVRCCASRGAPVPHAGLPCLMWGVDSAAVFCGKGVFDMATSIMDLEPEMWGLGF